MGSQRSRHRQQRFARAVVYALVLLLVLGLVGSMVTAALASPARAAPLPAPTVPGDGKPIVLIATAGWSWSEVAELATSTPDASATGADAAEADAAAALLSYAGANTPVNLVQRTAGDTTCPADAWLTISSGTRTRATPPTTDCTWPTSWDQAVEASQEAGYGAVPGSLVGMLMRTGTSTAAVGTGAELALTPSSGEVPASADTLSELVEDGLPEVTLVDTTAGSPKGSLAALVEALEQVPEDTRVVVASIADPTDPGLQLAVLPTGTESARGEEGGLLVGPSTHRPGLLQLTDLPTTLVGAATGSERVGMDGGQVTLPVSTPPSPPGPAPKVPQPVTVPERVDALIDDAVHAEASNRTVVPGILTLIGSALVLVLVSARALRRPERGHQASNETGNQHAPAPSAQGPRTSPAQGPHPPPGTGAHGAGPARPEQLPSPAPGAPGQTAPPIPTQGAGHAGLRAPRHAVPGPDTRGGALLPGTSGRSTPPAPGPRIPALLPAAACLVMVLPAGALLTNTVPWWRAGQAAPAVAVVLIVLWAGALTGVVAAIIRLALSLIQRFRPHAYAQLAGPGAHPPRPAHPAGTVPAGLSPAPPPRDTPPPGVVLPTPALSPADTTPPQGTTPPRTLSPNTLTALSTVLLMVVATPVMLLTDAANGARLSFNGPLGMDAIVAGRFYGMSNTIFALAAGALVVGVGAWVGHLVAAQPTVRARRVTAWVGVGLLGGLALVLDGSPQLGADVGGALTLMPTFAALAAGLAGVPMGWKRWLAVGAATVAVVGAFGILDFLAGSATHLGRFVGEVLSGTAGQTLTRKASALVAPFLSSALAVAALAVGLSLLAGAAWWLTRSVRAARRGHGPYAWLTAPGVLPGWLGAVWQALAVLVVVEVLVNDSGAAMFWLSAAAALPAVLAVVASTLAVAGSRYSAEAAADAPDQAR